MTVHCQNCTNGRAITPNLASYRKSKYDELSIGRMSNQISPHVVVHRVIRRECHIFVASYRIGRVELDEAKLVTDCNGAVNST